VFDMVTAPEARGRGHATLACATLLAWAAGQGARSAHLQVEEDNAPAIAVYRRFGFATLYTYHYRGRPGECR
jgi:ribosomal protein S18 acetylase RimI-like enzyme